MSVSGNFARKDCFEEDLDLLDALLPNDMPDKEPAIPAQTVNIGPLSFQQERLWFLSELEPDSAAYTIFNAFRLQGQLDEKALCAALEALVERHQALRTAIRSNHGQTEQVIMPTYMPLQKSLDLTSAEDEAALQRLLCSEAARPFSLSEGRPFRVVLAKLGPREHALMLSLHHIISDAWSMTILMGELAVLYHAYSRGEKPLLPYQSVRYIDYALWQRTGGVGKDRENKEMAYWLQELEGVPLLEVPTDFPRPQKQTFNGSTLCFQVPAATTRALLKLSSSERTTLFSVLMTAFHVLIGRHARQSDVAIGTSIAGRHNRELEGLIGFFSNMVMIRVRFDEDPSFRTLLQITTAKVHAAMEHATLTHDRLVKKMKIARDSSRNPLFQIAMTLLNLPDSRMSLGVLEAENLLSQQAARFDLELFLSESDGMLSGTFVYNTDLFLPVSISRLSEQWLILLADIASSPDKPVSRLALVNDPVSLLSLPLQDLPPTVWPLHELFLQQADKCPDRRALQSGNQSLTYGELAVQARHIAWCLSAAGIRAGEPVGLWFEPGFSMIAAMLGTWMAGGGYMPIDIHWPAERIATIIEDSEVRVILSDSHYSATLPVFSGIIYIEETDEAPPCELPQIDPKQLAYIIYTSGSTGRPKGVEVTHANVARLFMACARLFEFESNDVWSFSHSYAFDFSVWEIWGALLHGTSLLIVPPIVTRTPDSFYELLCDRKVTILSQTPSAFRQLMAAEEANPRESDLALRYVVFGGEALDIGSLASWMDRHGDEEPRLVNMYGITEITVHATFRLIGWADLPRPASSVIGTPLHDLAIRLLDPNGEPVPEGMTGEIFVGGAGVARGYRNQPALTAARFLRDTDGMVLYRSGDLARINAWGELEYLGRADSQIKLRGYRIEAGEIENALRRHPVIADAVVVVKGQFEAARLVAYVRQRRTRAQSGANVNNWRPSFDMIYTGAVENDELDVVGWNNSYDNTPLPLEHMRLWRDEILQRLRALRPTRILELGTGSGMLLLPLAENAERYQGLDFSAKAISRLASKVMKRGLKQVELEQREACHQAELPDDFDLVILNSIVQYFPNASYFLDVLEQAMQRLQLGGCLFVGDLRHLGLLRHFHASRLVWRQPEGAARSSLREQLAKMVAEEKELLVAPDFFAHWAAQRDDIARIDILPKVFGGQNELTTYRYDVVIIRGAPSASSPCAHLEASAIDSAWQGEPALFCSIPNSRLAAVEAFLTWLEDDSEATPTTQQWAGWAETGADTDPAACLVERWQLRAGAAKLYWSEDGRPGQFDLAVAANSEALPSVTPSVVGEIDLSHFFNTPAPLKKDDWLTTTLRNYLSAYLPDYMLPAVYIPLKRFPLTLNGKLDVSALPEPGKQASKDAAEQNQSLNDTEGRVAAIWSEVLQQPQTQPHANFFEQGGHSLLATQVILRLNAAFAVRLPLRSLFDHPTISSLAAVLDGQTIKTGSPLPSPSKIRPVPRKGLLPLSYTQQRFWFMEQIDRGAIGFHNISLALKLRGVLVSAALRAAIQTVVMRHEALRTLFVQHDGEPAQLIKSEWTAAIDETDFSRYSRTEAERALRKLISVQANSRFQLDVAPPLRLSLVKMAENEHVLQLTLHHAICDGWSLGVMIREFSKGYAAFVAGETPQLPPLPVQLADFAVWQRTELADHRLRVLLAQWKQRLQGLPYRLSLPFERAPQVDTLRMCQIIYFNFDVGQLCQLKELAEAHGVTLFMVLTAGYAALLGRYSGTNDVVIGTPVAHRQHKELEGIVGCFLNTLALRIQSEANISGQALLAHVRERVLEAYEWQDAPFDAVLSELNPERSRDQHGLFQTMLTLQNMPLGSFKLPGLDVEPFQGQESLAGCDLSLTFIETRDGGDQASLQGMLEYDANKFLHASVEHFSTQLHALLLDMAARPTLPVNRLSLLASGEREYLLRTLNKTEHPVPHQHCLHELIAFQVLRTPDSIAVRDASGEISYAELETRANALAWTLREHGVGPDSIVGLCTGRDRGMVIGLLGIMKAGAAYLPLDPAYPAARLNFMLADAHSPVLVTQSSLIMAISFSGTKILLDDSGLADSSPDSGVRPANLAYVIYTSGSTGMPKGVMITHSAIVNYLNWALTTYTPGSEGAVLMSPSYAFDGSMTTLFTPLLSGRCMYLMLRDDVLSRTRHTLLRSKEPLALIDCGPAQLEVLQQVMTPVQLANTHVGAIVIGGEVLHASTVERWRRYAPTARLYNEYGPTEATVGCCSYHINGDSPPNGQVPIGLGIWNVRVYILDEHLEPLPVGVPGNLYVAGNGLARGYAGKPALTAQNFIPDPFSEGGRLYRTGDCANWGTAGVIHYLGRNDNQVKFRGFRIELGEIEAKIRHYSGVDAAAVGVHADARGEPHLVAWLVSKNCDGMTSKLAAYLRGCLPGFMVPAHYVLLPELPISVNGKVDHSALPAPESLYREEKAREARALNAMEQRLAAIWSKVLGHPVTHPKADFFEIGGNSLLAVKLIFLIEREFKRTLPLASLFELHSLEAQAAALSAGNNGVIDALVPINVRGNAPSVVLVHDISGQILSYRSLAEELKAFGVYAIQSLPAQHKSAPSVAEMAELYAHALVMANVPSPLVLVGHSFGAQVAAELARRLTAHNKPPLLLAVLDGIPEPDRESLQQLPRDDLDLIDYMVRTIELSLEKRIDLDAACLRSLPESERAKWITAKVIEAGVVSEQTSPEHVMQLFTIYKNNLESLHGYRASRLTCPVALWATEALYPERDCGWCKYAERVEVQLACGDHISMLKPPHVQGLAAGLTKAINSERQK